MNALALAAQWDIQTILGSENHLLGYNDSIMLNLQRKVRFSYPGHERVKGAAVRGPGAEHLHRTGVLRLPKRPTPLPSMML